MTVAQDGFFRQPLLETQPNHEPDQRDEPPTEESSDSDALFSEDADSVADPWLLYQPEEKVPGYKTWDTFNVPDAARPEALCITEAGAAVYDALLCENEDSLNIKNTGHVVVDTKAYMAALLAVAVGRESVFFGYDAGSKSLKPVLPKFRISGYSAEVLRGVQDMSTGCGSMFRRLRKLGESTYAKHATPARVALASALDAVLDVIEGGVAVHSQQARSLLQLQSAIRDISAILTEFDTLVGGLRSRHSDEAILLLVFRHTVASEYKDVYVRDTMREVLQRVSRPWLDFVEEWLGVRPESGLPLTKESLGQRKGFVKVDMETYMDDFGLEVEDVDFRLDRDRVPEFLPDDVTEALFETGKNLRFIRSSHPDHPLSAQENTSHNDPPGTEWLYNWDSILDLERRVSEYQANLSATVTRARAESRTERDVARHRNGKSAGHELQIYGAETSDIERHIMSSMKELGQPLQEQDQRDKLKEIIRTRLSQGYSASEDGGLEFSPHWSLLPSLSFGPIVSAHGRIVNKESLRLLFTAHDLRGHVQLQRQFHLFGNGIFASRLSHALFDPDLETAERQQGVARQGDVMGLRLSGRDNWPPASSELRLALMGILTESYTPSSSDGAQELPGDLSFAVRDMAPEDVDKCMDQDSLEALDFLRLSYKPPAALTSILTPAIMMQYDRIFKLMLRVLRQVYVINRLSREVNSKERGPDTADSAAARFCFEANHVVNAVSGYFVDVGISMPWGAFERWLDRVQGEVTGDGPAGEQAGAYSPDRLRACHSMVLDHIMHALLLRKRQQPVLQLLE
ncbi:hypothetical protein IMZ48_36725, partial [Candidatus Bathyarchaeota archaeon]|nr:hypothetical protein [Candidatus Bathyarchaeota archaeon]